MAKEKTQKTKKEKAPKPKYNMAQNSAYMIKLAWTSGEKKVIVLSLLSALFAVALNLINLYVSPTILSVVERKGSITELIVTIAVFVGAYRNSLKMICPRSVVERGLFYVKVTA